MTDFLSGLTDDEPLGETSAALPFDLSELSVGAALMALQMAMARDGGTRKQEMDGFPLGPDLYKVRFGIGEAEFIQERHDMGPQYALDMVGAGRWTVGLLSDVVFTALVGGGLGPSEARRAVQRWVTGRPWGESAPLAQVLLQLGVVGVPDEPPGKQEGEATPTSPTSPEARSDSPPSTDTQP